MRWLLIVGCWSLVIGRCLPFVVRCLFVRCLLFSAGYSLFVVCCRLDVVRCLYGAAVYVLFAGCWLLFVWLFAVCCSLCGV